ncbi:MAG: hypothetical protein ACYCX2_04720 [Christensenellales bacterium]
MKNRPLYNDNKTLKAAGLGVLLFSFQLLVGLSTGWIILTILFSLLLIPCAAYLLISIRQWLKVQKMTDEEYAQYIESEKEKHGDVPKETGSSAEEPQQKETGNAAGKEQ